MIFPLSQFCYSVTQSERSFPPQYHFHHKHCFCYLYPGIDILRCKETVLALISLDRDDLHWKNLPKLSSFCCINAQYWNMLLFMSASKLAPKVSVSRVALTVYITGFNFKLSEINALQGFFFVKNSHFLAQRD